MTTDSSGTDVGGVSQEQATQQPAHSQKQFQSQQDVSGGLTHSYQGHQASHPGETQRLDHIIIHIIIFLVCNVSHCFSTELVMFLAVQFQSPKCPRLATGFSSILYG